ncbi:riboflavin biosynthesis protein RibF [uncultured Limosilactobacillus sp.]|uniref:riboflavin biosynthesis protein RibF n=1 Tax=uncultured Limosilactobacillus sp. TaxID=2837629 RepID=UPI0025CFB796|nr:riboflavin biosynthesis protein RibF [uncultured Limosilactobacillus sp.]
MQDIRLSYPVELTQVVKGPVVLAMGFFDGVHRGHQQVLATAKKIAEQKHQSLAVLTYDKLPAIVFRQLGQPVRYLTPLKNKLHLLAQFGVDIAYVMDFTSTVGELGPQAFVDEVVMELQPSTVVAGFDHTYGPKNIANMTKLPEYANNRFTIKTVGKLTSGDDHLKVSSTLIRELIDRGKVAQANRLLGYLYTTSGIIVHGFARGRTIGFPTANVQWPENERIPAVGVYVVRIRVQGQWFNGMASVGYNVTFGKQMNKTIEVNIFDFERHIYGEHVQVQWIRHLRDEIKFANVEELVTQLKKDQVTSHKVLSQQPLK